MDNILHKNFFYPKNLYVRLRGTKMAVFIVKLSHNLIPSAKCTSNAMLYVCQIRCYRRISNVCPFILSATVPWMLSTRNHDELHHQTLMKLLIFHYCQEWLLVACVHICYPPKNLLYYLYAKYTGIFSNS